MNARRFTALGAVALIATACGGGDGDTAPIPTDTSRPPGVVVTSVVDGDTIKVADGRTVRIIGIDAPETVAPDQPTGCFGTEASAFATRVLLNQRVELVPDPTQDAVDRYGRTLAYVDLADGTDFSTLAAREGVAYAYIYDTLPQLYPAIRSGESRAQEAGLGVWSHACGSPAPQPLAAPAGACEPGYDLCVPPYSQGDLDCPDLDGPYRVTGSDPHRLDRAGDGIGCE